MRHMKRTKNKRFFKLVMMNYSYFTDTYNITSPEDLYPTRRFYARGRRFDWCSHTDADGFLAPDVCVWNAHPLIHFCDNAIDMLMWYWVGMDDYPSFSEVYFYEIVPSLPYYKERCNDKNQFFQCGARAIQVIRQLSTGDVMRIAAREIESDMDEIIHRYPDQNMMKYIMRIRENVIQK